MKDTTKDSGIIDDSPGETLRDGRTLPGLLLAAIGVLALAISLFQFGIGRMADGELAAACAVLIGAGGVVWLLVEHRRLVHLRERSRHQ